jgi:hypothetical protein
MILLMVALIVQRLNFIGRIEKVFLLIIRFEGYVIRLVIGYVSLLFLMQRKRLFIRVTHLIQIDNFFVSLIALVCYMQRITIFFIDWMFLRYV